jgi:hypothetical protein
MSAMADLSPPTRRIRRRRTASPRVHGLIDRIRGLVAEERCLERVGEGDRRLEAVRREIARLQEQLANIVKRELSEATPAPAR